jgi:hypothetical protein
MLEPRWNDLVESVAKHRDRRAKFYKPVCLFAVTQLIDEGLLDPSRLSVQIVLQRFAQLVGRMFPRSEDKGWMPLWHLTSDGAWACRRDGQIVRRTEFKAGKPKSVLQLLRAVDYASVPSNMERYWRSRSARQLLRMRLLSMLETDDDAAAQGMAEYLSNRFAASSSVRRAFEESELAAEFRVGGRYIEDYSRLRAHVRIERNRNVIEAVKRLHGTDLRLKTDPL